MVDRCAPAQARRLLLAAAVVLAACGCSATKTSAGLPGADAGAQDVHAAADALGGADSPSQVPDSVILDTAALADSALPLDALDEVAPQVDIVAKDLGPSSKMPKCQGDADCKGNFGPCLQVGCSATSGNCELQPAPDGTACTALGNCGGSGVCQQGGCASGNGCAAQPCAPVPIECGAKIVLAAADLEPSLLQHYSCSAKLWDGGEAVFVLSSDVTVVAVAELSAPGPIAGAIFDLPAAASATCAPALCDGSAKKLTLGLGAGSSRVLVVDSLASSPGELTLTISCAIPTACGDAVCAVGESCATCAKDCGACVVCGDGKCDATYENCQVCAGDCGPCAAECTQKDTPGCAGCSCEACVCQLDSVCCTAAWDSVCASECGAKCGGPACGVKGFCGDGQCDYATESASCPNDCPPPAKCGDGICAPGSETCKTCSIDCGFCSSAPASCGDGSCNGLEHCGSCPGDCGVCGTLCVAKTGPSCNGCACEAAVCATDSYCCKTAWDNTCVAECAAASGQPCPKVSCGDGVCSGTETCASCKGDCGACPPTCGDGICDAPGEDKSTCAADCNKASCDGSCGTFAGSGPTECWCDDLCADSGDCCPDKAKYCP